MLIEINEDVFDYLTKKFHSQNRAECNFKVEHTHSFIVNVLLCSEKIAGSPLLKKFEFLKENVSWRDIK